MSSSINLIAATSYYACQPRHPHNYGTLPPNRLETRVAMIFADQNNEAYRTNVGRDFGGVQSISMVITQPLLIAKEPSSVN